MPAIVYSVVSSRIHPRMSHLYAQQGLVEKVFDSTRKAMNSMKKEQPQYLVADFVYGYSNNYAGVNISNLDVMLMAMQRYSPDTRVIVIAGKEEIQYVDHLRGIMPLHAVLQYPFAADEMLKLL